MCIERYSIGGSEKETRKITNVKLNYRLPWIFIRSAFYRADDRCNLTSFYFRSHGQIRAWSCEDYRSLRVVLPSSLCLYLSSLRVFFPPSIIFTLMKNNVSTNSTYLTIKNYDRGRNWNLFNSCISIFILSLNFICIQRYSSYLIILWIIYKIIL